MTTSVRRTPIPVLLISLSLLAWIALGSWGLSPYSRFLSHEGLQPADFSSARSLLIIMSGWLLMIVAMMLPTSLPLFERVARMTREQADPAMPVVLLLVGYGVIWMLFGMAAVFVDGLLHVALDEWLWLAQDDWPIGASLFGVAGLYQFTSLKSYCLKQFRSMMRGWLADYRDRSSRSHGLRLGVRHGLFSLGSSWALMLLMFAIGIRNLGWLVVFGTFIAIEKNISWGRQFRIPLGLLLLCCSLATVLDALLRAW